MFHRSSFFFNVPATTEIYTLSLHDALPIFAPHGEGAAPLGAAHADHRRRRGRRDLRRRAGPARQRRRLARGLRSEEHTSELQSHVNLVCRLLLEKKNNKKQKYMLKIDHAIF